MSNDTLASKIELLNEQIQNLENSAFFTEKEMDRLSFPLRSELESLKKQIEVIDVEILTPNSIKA